MKKDSKSSGKDKSNNSMKKDGQVCNSQKPPKSVRQGTSDKHSHGNSNDSSGKKK